MNKNKYFIELYTIQSWKKEKLSNYHYKKTEIVKYLYYIHNYQDMYSQGTWDYEKNLTRI
jgi:hypothetical protein